VGVQTLDPTLNVIAPLREWEFRSREDEMSYAKRNGIPVSASKKKPYSIDRNIWGVSIEAGVLEDPWKEAPEEAYQLTKAPELAPRKPLYLEIGFEDGVPASLGGRKMELVHLIERLNRLGGRYGVGRLDQIENRLVGIKSREIYEAPAAMVLHAAHRELENMVTPRELQRLKRRLSQTYADLVYDGLWFTQTREAIDAFVASVQQRVTGIVRLKLFKGDCRVVGRKSPCSLYDHGLATYEAGDLFDHSAAVGFIKIFGLPVEIASRKAPAGIAPARRPTVAGE